MDTFLELLRDFLSAHMSADDFTTRYIQLWKDIRDEQHHILSSHPKLKKAYDRLKLKRDLGFLNEESFDREVKRLFASAEDCRIAPGSKEDRIISHLMVEADVYEPDTAQRKSYQIGEAELIAEAQKALDELSSDQD